MPAVVSPPSIIANRFVLEALGGVGGMGTVYRARDSHGGRVVALKLLQATTNPKDTERFAREAQILSELRHPGIVEYLSHGITEAGQPYLAMEWMEGEDLSRRLARGGLGLSESLTLLRRTAEALAVAHRRGVVHRDIKPSNLFLRDGDVERVALLDFGIARGRALAQAITGTGVVIGTPAYMAPEQARGEPELMPAADVFSLGCVLFECLIGEPPFVAEQVMAVLAKILFTEPAKLRQRRPELPEAVELLLGRMLEKDPRGRLRDAAAVLAALAALDVPLDVTALTVHAPVLRSEREGTEQHLVSVLIATPEGGPGDESTLTMESDSAQAGRASGLLNALVPVGTPPVRRELNGLSRALQAYGARVELLANGSLVATLVDARGTATDQAAQAARCALLIQARWPEATIALCTGRGLLRDRLPIGEVLDRATLLLRDRGGQRRRAAERSSELPPESAASSLEPGERSSELAAAPEAPPSAQILLDEVTRGLLDVRFRLARTPSGSHLLLGQELTLDASRPLLGKPTPCVGREAELGMLESVLAGVIDNAVPRAVLVTAPPGVGKSRLRHELVRRLSLGGGDLLILIGRGDPISAGSGHGMLGQALRHLCGILDGESLDLRRARLTQRLAENLPGADGAHIVAFLGELCGIPFPDEHHLKLYAARHDPLIMSDQITLALLDFLRAECAVRPLLLILEDLHWGDALTLRLVEIALRELGEHPLMVLALARPEVEELLPPSWAGISQPLPLRLLSRKAGERLAHEVLGARMARETIARIVEQSAGNALFLEELIRGEAEGRGGEAPETVVAILQARIGRIEAGARRVLRAASVFGETAWVGGIQALLGPGPSAQELDDWLPALVAIEILEERRESRFPGEREVHFRHALMRDAAYGLMTTGDRVDGHRAAAAYLSALDEPDVLVLAEHFEKGHETARAVPCYLQAAEQAYDTNDMEATLACAERGLGCGAQGEQRGALLSLKVGVFLGRERYSEVIALGSEALDLLPEGCLRWCRTFHCLFPAMAITQQLALLAELSGRIAGVEPSPNARSEYVRAMAWLSVVLGVMGRKDGARAFLGRIQQVVAATGPGDLLALGYLYGTQANDHHLIEDRPWACFQANVQGTAALEAAGDRRGHIILQGYHGKALLDLGDPVAAEALLRDNVAMAEQVNESLPLSYARTYLAHLLAATASIERLDEPARLVRAVIEAKNGSLIGVAHGVLAQVARRRGDLDSAAAEARTACEAARPFPPYSWDLIALRMRILLDQGHAGEALGLGEEALRELEHLGISGSGEIALRLAMAEVQHALGQVDAARDGLAGTLRRFWLRLEDIPEASARQRYLTGVPLNVRLLDLGKAWLGDDAVRPPGLT